MKVEIYRNEKKNTKTRLVLSGVLTYYGKEPKVVNNK